MVVRLPARRAFSYPRPITFVWLVRHELVLSLGKFLAIPKKLGISFIIVVSLLASGFGALFATIVPLEPPASMAGMVYALAIVVLVFAVIISTIMPIMIERLFARTDQALIVGSIVDPLRWLYAQAIAVAIGASGIFYLILLPTVAIASIRGAYWTLSWPIAFTALVLMSCAVSFAIGKLFVRWFGVARAKRFVQVAAILLGVALYVGSQIFQMRAIASDNAWHISAMVQTGIRFVTNPWLGNWGAGLAALGASLLAISLALKSLKNSVSDLLTGGSVPQRRSIRIQSRVFQASSVMQVALQEIKICVRDPVTSAQAMS